MLVMPMQSGREMLSVLVAEDDDDIRELVCELIHEHIGCEVHAARNGREAIAMLRDLRDRAPRLILLDWMMPEMSGADLLESLRADDVLAAIPVVIVSAAQTIDASQSLRVFRKPVSMDAILSLVREHCEGTNRSR
jgi:CheY-like chemotaxis protein